MSARATLPRAVPWVIVASLVGAVVPGRASAQGGGEAVASGQASAEGGGEATVPGQASTEGGGFYIGAGLGPAAHLQGWPTQFRLEEEIGYYVEGRPEGFFLAFAPSQSFFANKWTLTFAPRFGYMLVLFRSSDINFQLGPAGTIPGIAVQGCSGPPACKVGAYFHFAVGLMLRVLFADEHIGVYVRPAEFEFAFGPMTAIRYVLQAGVNYHF